MRKAPTVDENVRVVMMGGFECVACGGTHPAATGEISLVKILSCHLNRGKQRVSFLCGERAYRHYQLLAEQANAACACLSCPPERLAARVAEEAEAQKSLRAAMEEMQTRAVMRLLPEAMRGARLMAEGNLVLRAFEDAPEKALMQAASLIAEKDESAAALLFGTGEERVLAVFARGKGCPADMGAVMKAVFPAFGGRGGGKSDFARGSLPAGCDMEALFAALREEFR